MPAQSAGQADGGVLGLGREMLRERMLRDLDRKESVLDNEVTRDEGLKDRQLQTGMSEEDYRTGRERDDEEYDLATEREADRYGMEVVRGINEDHQRWTTSLDRRKELRELVTSQARETLRERLSGRPPQKRTISA